MMLESRRRYYFLAIAEHLNITKAAASLMIAQPSLTQYLNQLEKELDAKLIDRKYSPLRLTRAGQIYYDYLKEAQYKDQEMRAKIAAETAGERLPLRIGVPMQKSQNVTQTLLPQFTEAYPNVTFSIWEGTTTTVRNRVIQGEIDIGFGHTRIEGDQQYIIEDEESLCISKFECAYRAVRRSELTGLLHECGCREVVWKMPDETGFYQPVVIAKKTPECS